MTLIDFIIGALFANAMPHLVLGLTRTHFLGLFGYSPKGNILYAVLQFIIGLSLYSYYYKIQTILENGFLIGALCVLLAYFILGKFMVSFYEKKN